MGVYCYKKEAYDREPLPIAAVSTILRFQKYAFSLSWKMHRSLRVHTTVLMRFRLSTFENDRIARCQGDVSWTYKHTRPRYFRSSFSFWCVFRPFSTVHTNTISMSFRFDPLSRAFSNRCVSDENAQHISVDGRPKRIEMYAFLDKNALVWKGP